MQPESPLTAAADQLDNDARLPVIIIMRRANPRRTWREIGRKLRINHATVYRIARRAGVR